MRCILTCLLALIGFVVTSPAARADWAADFVHVECDPKANYFSARPETMNNSPPPKGRGFVDAGKGVKLGPSPEGDGTVVKSGAQAVIASCTIKSFSDGPENLTFEVRRTAFYPAWVTMCRGMEGSDFVVTLNGMTISTWPSNYTACARSGGQVPVREGLSVDYTGYFVRRCSATAVNSLRDRQEIDETILCRRQTPRDVLSEAGQNAR